MATNIDGILEATRVGQQVLDGVMRLVPAGEKLYRINRPEQCICPELKDIVPIRVADMGCPVHGVDVQTASSGDGLWRMVEVTDGE